MQSCGLCAKAADCARKLLTLAHPTLASPCYQPIITLRAANCMLPCSSSLARRRPTAWSARRASSSRQAAFRLGGGGPALWDPSPSHRKSLPSAAPRCALLLGNAQSKSPSHNPPLTPITPPGCQHATRWAGRGSQQASTCERMIASPALWPASSRRQAAPLAAPHCRWQAGARCSAFSCCWRGTARRGTCSTR